MAGDSKDFLIRIIVRALNESRGVFREVAGDMDKLGEAEDKADVSTTKLNKSHEKLKDQVDTLHKSYAQFNNDLEKENKNVDAVTEGWRRYANEYDKMSRKQPIGSRQAEDLRKVAQQIRANIQAVKDSQKADEVAARAAAAARAKEASDIERISGVRRRAADQRSRQARSEVETTLKMIKGQDDLRRSINDTVKAYEDLKAAAEKAAPDGGGGLSDRQRVTIDQHRNTLSNLARRATTTFGAGSPEATSAGVAARDAGRFIKEFGDETDRAGRKASTMEQAIARLNKTLDSSHGNVAGLSARLRGLLILGVISFLSQVVSVVTALGATLVSVASAAIEAGGALGGALVAGAAQAIPVIGLLISAFGRIGAVFKAVQQATKANQQAADDHTAALNRQQAAAEAVKSAQESLADANRQVTQAQKDLKQAVAGSADEYEKLKLAVIEARDAQRSADLQLKDAQRTRERDIASGNIDAQASNDIAVSTARTGVANARIQRSSSARDLTQAGGPSGVQSVVQATKALQGAEQSARRAGEALQSAQRQAVVAAAETTGAAKTLQQLKGQLDKTELALFDALERLRKEYKKVFGPINDVIVGAFTDAVTRVTKVLPRLGQILKPLADEIAKQGMRINRAFTNNAAFSFYSKIANEARKNLGPLTTLFLTINHIAQNIALAAAPALRKFIDFIVMAATGADKATSGSGGLKKLQDFFLKGEVMAESIAKLGWAVVQLFAAVVSPSADSGKKSIEDLTVQIQKTTKWLRAHATEVRHFFDDARKAAYEVIGVVVNIVKALAGLYHPGNVKALADVFNKTLLPALSLVFGVTGQLTHAMLTLLATPVGSSIAKFALVFLGLSKVISILNVGLFGLIGNLGKFVGGRYGVAMVSIAEQGASKFGVWGLAIAAVVAAIVLLDQKFHFIKPTIEAVERSFNKVWPSIQRAIMSFVNWVKQNWEGLVIVLTGPIGIAIVFWAKHFDLLKAIVRTFVNFVKNIFSGGGNNITNILATPFRIFFDTFKAIWASIYHIFKGVIETITHIARGEWGDAWKSFRNIFVNVFKDLLSGVKNIGRDLARGIVAGFKNGLKIWESIGDWLYDNFIKPILKFFGIASPSSVFADIGKDLARGIVKGFKYLPSLLFSALKDMAKDLGNIGAEVIKAIYKGITSVPNDILKKINPGIHLGVKVPGLGHIGFAAGGPVPGSPSAGDVQPALLTGGEHVWTAGEVARAGGHAVMFALRAFLGGGGQGGPVGYAAGGQVGSRGTTAGVDFSGMIGAVQDGGSDLAKAWRTVWHKINDTVDNANDSMRRSIRSSLKTIQSNWDDANKDLLKAVTTTLDSLTSSVFSAMDYVSSTTNKALKAFDASPVKISISKPKSSAEAHAGGGVVGGTWGERGPDLVNTWLGRGEVVLNWMQQKAVNARMAGQDTLQSIMGRVRGEHAGGGAPGLARGGGDIFNGHPSNVHPWIKQLIVTIQRHWPQLVVSDTTDHPYLTSSGHKSDHVDGNAVDMSGSPDYMKRVAEWIKTSGLYRQLKQGIHNPNLAVNAGQLQKPPGQFAGQTWLDHIDHIHLAMVHALSGSFGGDIGVGRVKVNGKGSLAKMVSKMVSKVRSAAKKALDGASMTGLGTESDIGAEAGNYTGPLDHTFPSHRLGQPGARLSRSQVLGLVLKAGLPRFFVDIARGESGYSPGVVSNDGGFGLWQMTPRVQSAQTVSAWHKIGSYFNPWKNALQAKYLFEHAKSKIPNTRGFPWYGTEFLKGYASGGPIGGPLGRAVPIVAHAGEWVLNKGQQMKAAMLAGLSPSALKKRLGFGGGPMSFADGGEVVGTLLGQIRTSASKLAKGSLDKFKTNFQNIVGEGGLLEQLQDAIDAWTTNMATALKAATYRIDRFGRVILRLDPTQQAQQAAVDLVQAYERLVGEKGALQGGLKSINERISAAQKKLTADKKAGKATGKDQDLLDKLLGYRTNIKKSIDAVDAAISDNVETRYQAVETWVNAMVTSANDKAGRRTARIDVTGRFAALVGPTLATAAGIGSEALAGQRQHVLATQVGDLQGALVAARAAGRGDLVTQISDQISDLQVQIAEAAQAGIQGAVDEVTTRYARQTTGNDIATRIATALGKVDDVRDLISSRITIVGNEIGELVKQRDAARASGLIALADTINDQVKDLQTSLVELAAQQLQDSIDIVNNASSRRSGQLDLQDRLANLTEQAGNFAAAFSQRGDILAQRGNNIAIQRNALYGLLAQAQTMGNQGQIDALTDQIAELDVQLQENTAAISANTVAARQAAIDAITNRGGFLGGVSNGLFGLLSAMGALSGTVDIARQQELLKQAGVTLGQTGSGLREQLASGYGVDVRGLNDTQLVDALRTLNYDGIEANFSVDQKQQFENLINSIIENATAVDSNTDQLNQLNGNTTQSFSSSAWQLFRNAIFNGSGQLLPQYQHYASMAGGGTAITDGFIKVHAGETMIPAAVNRDISAGENFVSVIEVTEQVREYDAEVLANKQEFRFRNRSTSARRGR